MTLNGMIVLGSSQQAEHNFDKWAEYRTKDVKAKLLLAVLIAYQYEQKPMTMYEVEEKSLLSRYQIKRTINTLTQAGLVRLKHNRCMQITFSAEDKYGQIARSNKTHSSARILRAS
jgi:DNA-binding transcriptional regulator GbsR (MarR family)